MNKRGHVLNAALLAIGLGVLVRPAAEVETVVTIAEIFVPIVLGALFPDVDTAFGKHRKTLHNLPVLLIFLAYPIYFGNLQWVWIGVLSHYLLDVLGSKRGIALFYPLWSREFGFPFGVSVRSRWSSLVMVLVTGSELALAAEIVERLPPDLAGTALAVLGVRGSVDGARVEPSPVGRMAGVGRFHPREHQSVELPPRVLPEQVREFGPTTALVVRTRAMAQPPGHTGSKEGVQICRRPNFGLERRPDLADGRGEMGVRRTERRKTGLASDLSGAAVVRGEVFRVVDLDSVKSIEVAVQVDDIDAHGYELGVRGQHHGILSGEFSNRALEGVEIGYGIVETEREDVFSVPDAPGEDLASGHHEQLVVAESLRARLDLRQPGEMRRVDEHVDLPVFGPPDDLFVEDLHVRVDTSRHRSGVLARRICELWFLPPNPNP